MIPRMVKFKDIILNVSTILLKKLMWNINLFVRYDYITKLISMVILFGLGIMFISIRANEFVTQYGDLDLWIWAVVTYSIALVQAITLINCHCVDNYRWSNTVLIISGFLILIIGCLFGLKFPPYNWQMVILPPIGFIISVIGRNLNKTSQLPKRVLDATDNNKFS